MVELFEVASLAVCDGVDHVQTTVPDRYSSKRLYQIDTVPGEKWHRDNQAIPESGKASSRVAGSTASPSKRRSHA